MPMVFILIALVLAAALAVGAWHFFRGRSASTMSACGKCGYPVAGLPTFTCPECGSDLREVGIVPARAPLFAPGFFRRHLPLLLALGLWTLIYGALYLFIGSRSYPRKPEEALNRSIDYGLLDAYYWPYEGESLHAVTLEPRSGAYRRVTVTEERHARFKGWRNAPLVNWTGDSPPVGLTRFTINLQLDTADAKTMFLHVDPATLAWNYADSQNPGKSFSGPGPIDGPVVWGWMINSGVDVPSPSVRDEADALADLVTRTTRSGTIGGAPWAIGRLERIAAAQRDALPDGINTYPFKFMRGSARDSYGPAWSIYWLSIPFGLGIYSYGLNWIFAWLKKPATGAAR